MCECAHTQKANLSLQLIYSSSILYMQNIHVLHIYSINVFYVSRKEQEWMKKKTPNILKVIGYKV